MSGNPQSVAPIMQAEISGLEKTTTDPNGLYPVKKGH